LNSSENELCGHKILLFPDTTIGRALTRLGQGYFSTWQMFVENFTFYVLTSPLYPSYTRNV